MAVDSEGKKVWEAEFDIYGKMHTFAGKDKAFIPFRWQGMYFDEETELCYVRHRYYSEDTGTFISQDPISIAGGLNLYSYVHDCNAWVDLLGLSLDGGGYGSVRRAHRGLGGEVNHMPANSASQAGGSGISRYRGPATMMDEIDHYSTASWGNRTTSVRWRELQEELIRNNKFGKAMEMDIRDLKRKFGSKYNKGMTEMVDYAIEQDFITRKEGQRLKRKYLHH